MDKEPNHQGFSLEIIKNTLKKHNVVAVISDFYNYSA